MRRICQEEMISYFFEENQVRHREVMSIITNQTLDPILPQQVIEHIFAFAPAAPRTDSQCQEEQVSQCRFPRIIFGSCHRQYRVPPSPYHSGLACRFISENTFSGSGVASASWRLSRAVEARLSSTSLTYNGWISSRCRSNCRAFSRWRRALPRSFLVVSMSA